MIHGGAIPRLTTNSDCLPSNYKEAIGKINSGLRVCVILRGLPGSGKSYLAKRIIADTIQGDGDGHVISADSYFMKGTKYVYDSSKIGEAHDFAQKKFLNHASKGYSPLIIDNTHMKYWEMFCYLQGAVQYQYAIYIMEPTTTWRWNVNICAQKNIHGVPLEGIKRMKNNYESGCTLEQMLMSLNLQPVIEPKMREVPTLKLIEIEDENLGCEIEPKIDQNANFHDTNPFKWTQPPQVFDENWDAPKEEKEEIFVKPKVEKPQPQRKKSKDKKDDLVPHRKNCPNENEKFTQLRELYPEIIDSYIWDLFVQCKGDSNWVAEILCEDNKTNDMKGDELSCDCGISKSSSGSSSGTSSPLNRKVNKPKTTPTRSKKTKTADSECLKQAIEANVKIGEEFYPDHVREVKKWKNPLLPTPVGAQAENGQPPPNTNEVVELSINKQLIYELDDRFGDGLLKFSSREFPNKIFISDTTARQLHEQIMEAFKSQDVENQLEAVKNDREFAQSLADIERVEKYPKLYNESSNLKDIMESQEALKNYEQEMNGWQKENETLAIMIKKQRLYKAFPNVSQDEINQLFEILQYDFNETVKMLQENLGYTKEQCKKVKQQLDNDQIWRSDSSGEEEAENGVEEEETGITKLIEDLREEIETHNNERHNCNRIAAEKRQAKDFQVASYYANMAALHKKKVDEKTLELSCRMAELHAQKQDSPTHIDLHFHNASVATTMLHTFLDKNIARLRDIKKPYEELSIVTGRGMHSKGGIATLKIATIQLLKERNLRSTEVNPGLLRVKIFQNSLLSTDLGK